MWGCESNGKQLGVMNFVGPDHLKTLAELFRDNLWHGSGTQWAASLKGKQHAEGQVHGAISRAKDAPQLKKEMN